MKKDNGVINPKVAQSLPEALPQSYVSSKLRCAGKELIPLMCSWESCVIIIKVSRFLTILYVIYASGCIVMAVMSRAGDLAQISARTTAEAVGQSTANMVMRNMFKAVGMSTYEPVPNALPIVTYQDKLRTIPQVLSQMSIGDTSPVWNSVTICFGQFLISKFLQFQ